MKTWREECAVFGVWNDPEAARLTYLGLYALQHRGQEGSGIVSLEENKHIQHKGLGLVGKVFPEPVLQQLKGSAAIGHNRYSTAGGNTLANVQPLTATLRNGPFALAHNGNFINAQDIRNVLVKEGSIFQGSSDTECVLHLIAKSAQANVIDAIEESLEKVLGAYCFTMLTKDSLIAVRDPWGFRPLVLGKRGEAYIVSSETCAFDLIGAEYIREIEPGEIFWVDKNGEHSKKMSWVKETKLSQCVFEHVYFARPDSVVFGESVYEARKNMGRELAKECGTEADIVIPVPDSGMAASLGYSQESGINFDMGIIRNHYVGRTFIEPIQSIRSFGVRIKLNPQSAILKNKRVIVVDDSLVRGTTSKKIVSLIRQAGAKEVHFKVAAPPTISPCYYGVDTPEEDELIASHKSVEEIREFIGADSLQYLSLSGLKNAVKSSEAGACMACFTKEYPIKVSL